MKKFEIGDIVYVYRQIGFTAGGCDHDAQITNITTKYDEDTGEPYAVIWCGSCGFDERTGYPICPPWAYQIDVR